MLLGLVLLATITTAVPIRSAHPPTFYTFAGATTAPLLFVLLTSVDPFYQLVGIAGGAYVGHLMAYVRDVHRWQYDNIALAYQKEDLARRLQVAYDEARACPRHRHRRPARGRERQPGQVDLPGHGEPRDPHADERRSGHDRRAGAHRALGRAARGARAPCAIRRRRCCASSTTSSTSPRSRPAASTSSSIELSTVELIEGAAETLAPQAVAKGLSLVAYVAADVPERVIGDPLRLQQILFNLLGNAIKFTETGSVRLSLENAGDGMLRIKVADTGIGLTDEQREPAVPAVRAGRQLDHAPLRRHRPRPVDRAPPRRGHAGRRRGRERAGRGLDLHRHGAASDEAAPTRSASIRPLRGLSLCRRPARRRRGAARSPAISRMPAPRWRSIPTAGFVGIRVAGT